MSGTAANQRHRGRAPEDERLFAPETIPVLRRAVADLSWLLGKGYNEASAQTLVGDRYALTQRQRQAVRCCSCGEPQAARRHQRCVEPASVKGQAIAIDAFNALIILESALSGGVLLRGRDGCLRDLASIHGTYRQVAETPRAIDLISQALTLLGPGPVGWILDQPVSNSGRLKVRLAEAAETIGQVWDIQLHPNPDRFLVDSEAIVVTSDAWILERCGRYLDLIGLIVPAQVPSAWLLDLGAEEPAASAPPALSTGA